MIRNRLLAVAAAGVCGLLLAVGSVVSSADAMGGFQASSYDDDIANAKDRQTKLAKEIEELEAALENTDAEIVEAAKKLAETEAKIPAAQQELDEATEALDAALVEQQLVADKLEAAEAQDRAITQQIEADEDRIGELQDIVAELARAQYQGVGDDEALSLVFGSATSEEFIDRFAADHNAARVQSNALADVEEIAAVNRNRGSRQEAVREYIVELKAEADALVELTTRLRAEAQAKRDELDRIVDEQKRITAELEAKRDEVLEQQRDLTAKQDAVMAEIKELVEKKLAEEAERKRREEEARRKAEEEARRKAEEEAAAAAGSGSSSSGSTSSGTGSSLTKGALAYPTALKYITSSYGMRFHPVLQYWRLHAGTDFRAYCGTPILAARSGTVIWATYQPGFGNQVMLDHDIVGGKVLMTSYNHLTSFSVRSGQTVSKGQVVGYSGNTGTSTACHLHFETYVNGATVDPMTLVG
ncbi:M23 family metallopeptidase [Demequina pelophila]|uniref:M23 family metallopeptidase n=1 Tax=Demequina pelophila TaxID=1638984 RepID=UPI0007840640|nr:M23 family metallopeptidase [Demequina pelophila]